MPRGKLSARFIDVPKLIRTVDDVRAQRDATWGTVSHQTGIKLNIMHNLRVDGVLGLNTLVALCIWTDRPLDFFVWPERIAEIRQAVLQQKPTAFEDPHE